MSAARIHAPTTAFAVAVFGIATFSVMDVLMKGLVIALGVYDALLWRLLLSVIPTTAIFLIARRRWPGRAAMRVHATRATVTAIMALLFFWGLGRVPLAQGVALTYIAPLLSLFLAALLLGERIGRRTLLASLLALAGVMTILSGQLRADLGAEALLGTAAILASALCYAWNIVLMRQQALVADAVEIAFIQGLLVTLLLLPAAPLVATIPAREHWPVLAIGAVLAVLSVYALGWAYRHAEASYLSATEYTSFLWASLFGWWVFGEAVSPFTLVGAAMIVAGCLWAARARAARPEAEALVA